MVLNKDYKQDITIRNYSAYVKDGYSPMFRKLYKGVVVRVSPAVNNNVQFCNFSIKTKKLKESIFKTSREKMYSIIFNDVDCSITCYFDAYVKNLSQHTLGFQQDVYSELRLSIPSFMAECGCSPKEVIESESELKLVFY